MPRKSAASSVRWLKRASSVRPIFGYGDATRELASHSRADMKREANKPLFRCHAKKGRATCYDAAGKAGAKEKTILRQWLGDMGGR